MADAAIFEAFLMTAIVEQRRKRKRREWVRNIFLERPIQGDFFSLLPKLRNDHPNLFFNYLRMDPVAFDYLLALIEPQLLKKNTNMRTPICPAERLGICLRFLASGNSYTSIGHSFRVGKSTVSSVVYETCKVIWDVLQPLYLKAPSIADFEEAAADFHRLWNFPNCVGALDGKHVNIQAPAHSGSTFFNYKGSHSIILMAVCNASYKFLLVDIGNFGRISDGGIFGNSQFGKKILYDVQYLPPESHLPSSPKIVPHVVVGDEAFPLKRNLMRPYSGKNLCIGKRVFNYRLSRARRCIENAFGILTARWRIMRESMNVSPERATLIVQACCCLHNFLMQLKNVRHSYCPPSYGDTISSDDGNGEWRQNSSDSCLTNSSWIASNNYSQSAESIRETFTTYFLNEGAVDWQPNQVEFNS